MSNHRSRINQGQDDFKLFRQLLPNLLVTEVVWCIIFFLCVCIINQGIHIAMSVQLNLTSANYRFFFFSSSQVIIPVFWIFSLILNIPGFLSEKFDTKIKSNSCFHDWPAEWMPKAYYVMWFAFFGISFTLMVVLYSRVVYSLWFKRTDDSGLTYQQQVC